MSNIIVPGRPGRPIVVDAGGRIPAGGTEGQSLVKSSNADFATEWGYAQAAWGEITGSVSAQADLVAALGLKTDTSALALVALSGAYADLTGKPTLGTAAAAATTDFATAAQGALAASALQPGALIPWADVTGKPTLFSGAYADLTGIPATFAPSAHGHVIGDVTGLQVALDGKQAAGSYAAAVHGHVVGDVTGLQAALDGKQATLVSGTTIKTLNGSTILGSGDIVISASAVWGGIAGTLSAQTDLQAALNARQPLATVLTNTTAAFTTAQETKLAGIAAGATVNASDAALRDRATHTGTQLAATISDLAAAVAATPAVTANTAKVSNATHTGDAAGDTALTLQPAAITGRTLATAEGADYILISDTSDGGALKKALASDLAGGGGGGSGDVVGPASATNDALAGFDGTTGKLIKAGSKTLTQVAGIVDEVVTARGSRSALGLRINTISNFASPNAGGIITSLYYDNAFHSTGSQTSGALVDRAAMAPFYTSTPMRIDQIGVSVVAGVVDCLAKCFIYGSDAEGWPSDLLYVGGSDLDCSVTTYVAHTLDFTFESGRQYWLGAWVNKAVSFRGVPIASAVNLGILNGTATTYLSVVRRLVTYGTSLPDPWTLIASDLASGVAPFSIRMRAAAL